MNFRHLLFLILFIALFYAPVSAKDNLRIKGKITAEASVSLDKLTVVLSEITMKEQLSIVPFLETKPDHKGNYHFEFAKKNGRTFYRVSVSYQDHFTGSNPLKFDKGVTSQTVDLALPKITHDAHGLIFEKKILYLELLETGIRVTDVLNVTNNSSGIIDIRDRPLKFELPAEAEKPYFERKYSEFDVKFSDGNALMYLMVPQGRHKVFFQYDLPETGDFSFKVQAPPLTGAIEVASNHPDLLASFESDEAGFSERVVVEDKQVGTHNLKTHTVKLQPGQNQLTVRIERTLLAQKKLFYPATLLLIFLLSGLFWYVKIKQPLLAEKEAA
ncbi:MAG: hypothetical protein OEY59_03725 [Deltaproteobacteria bacterium]|nr:hypothetical protein [Deltaproteobacteria bacterium]